MDQTAGTIIVLGLARSGSTLLGLLLGSHPKVITLGEFINWYRIHNPHLRIKEGQPGFHKYFSFCKYPEETPPGRDRCSSCLDAPCPVWSTMPLVRCRGAYQKIRKHLEIPWLVDTSKHSHFFDALLEENREDNFILLLSHKTVWAFGDSMSRCTFGIDGVNSASPEQLQLIGDWWGWEHLAYKDMMSRHGVQIYSVFYDDLALNPRRVIEAVLSKADLDFYEQQLHWASLPHHQIAGNPRPQRAMKDKDSSIELDPRVSVADLRVREVLLSNPAVQRALAWISTLPALHTPIIKDD